MRGDPNFIGPLNGGINTRDTILDIPMSQAFACMNVIGSIDGSCRKRDPHVNLQSTFTGAGANDLSSLFFCVSQGTLLTSAGTKMYAVTKTAGVVTDITGAVVLSSNAPYSYVEAPTNGGQGPVYILPADLTTTPLWSDGAGSIANWTASAGTLDKGDFMVYFKNRVIMAGLLIGTSGCGIKASAVGNPRDWDTTLTGSSVAWLNNIDPTDGEKIYGLGTIGNYLIVFKKTKCYVVYDIDTGANRPLSTSVGCTSRKSIVTTPHGLMFLGNDGHVYMTDGTKVEKLSDVVGIPEAGVDNVTGSNSVNPAIAYFGLNDIQTDDGSQASWACAAYADDKYYVSIISTANGAWTWVFDFNTQSWWPMQSSVALGKEFTQIITDRQRSNQEQLYGIVRHSSSKTPRLWKLFFRNSQLNAWADPTANYQSFYQTPALAPMWLRRRLINNPTMRRRYHALRLYASGTVDVQHVLDDLPGAAVSAFTTDVSIATGNLPAQLTQFTIYSLGVGNTIRLNFTQTSSQPFLIQPFVLFTHNRTD